MSNPGDADATPIESVRQLAEYFDAGSKPRGEWRIGTEHEKFGFHRDTLLPPPYQPSGIEAVLGAIDGAGGWETIEDTGQVIGLKGEAANKGASISLEPAGQFELSGAAVSTLHDTEAEFRTHFATLSAPARPLGLGFAPLGFHPFARRADMPWMPKSRYAIMRRYMPLVGTRGLDMMTRTCTVQVNLDFGSEADMARKLRVSLALQPLATALFANSPFYEGAPNGFLSNRALVWTDVDNGRSGMPPGMFEDGFGFERHTEWLLDVPMYFVARDSRLIDVAGASFREFMAGRVPALAGITATVGDWADHVTTAFTDVRLKRFLEMRGSDAGSPAMMLAQSAFWVGLLYDDAALHAAEALVRRQPWAAYATLRAEVPRTAMSTAFGGGTLRDLARDALAIARDGLRARGHGEERFIDILDEMAAGGPTEAERWLALYEGEWKHDVRPILAAASVC